MKIYKLKLKLLREVEKKIKIINNNAYIFINRYNEA